VFFSALLINTLHAALNYCYTPPFIDFQARPNILIILDNSNSMDEDFYGNAVGSFSPASKSSVARRVIRDLATQLKDRLRIGLITYNLKTASSYHLQNMAYFASFSPASYCPTPPAACIQYCQTDNSTAKNTCATQCQAQNSLFNVDYFKQSPQGEEILTTYAVGSEQRNRYCELVQPKTQRQVNLTDPSNYVYFKHAYPYYAGSNQGAAFCYSDSYNPYEGSDTYACHRTKTGSADTHDGLTNYFGSYSFTATDSDIALGYRDFGRRLTWYYVGRTWFGNDSYGTGKIQVNVGDLVDAQKADTTAYNTLMRKLTPFDNNETGYMSCTATDKNNCEYIVNAGLTPTAGSIKTAYDYFAGTSSPILYKCQQNFIILVTDGLPSVNESGVSGSTDTLMPQVLTRLDELRSITKRISNKNYNFDIKTYVLGVGLSQQAKARLDDMAVHGGTAVDGHAYYADNEEEFVNAQGEIFANIIEGVASATSVSILSERTQQGANLMQAVFYPARLYGTLRGTWVGYLFDYWLYVSKTKTNIREDTDQNATYPDQHVLSLKKDYVLDFGFDEVNGVTIDRYEDVNGDGEIDANETIRHHVDTVGLDGTRPIWEAGKILFQRSASSRTIYTVNTSSQRVEFNTANLSAFSSMLGSPTSYHLCLGEASDNSTRRNNLVNYIRGTDVKRTRPSGSLISCRNRTFTIDGQTGTWKLGDIVYSTPKDVIDVEYCYNQTSHLFNDQVCTQNVDCTDPLYNICRKKESVVFTGANDGMLHAFKTGVLSKSGLSAYEVGKLEGSDFGQELWGFIPKNSLPYLRYLPAPDYCHLAFSDLSPFITTMGNKRVLIGGMRLGGSTCTLAGSTYTSRAPADTCASMTCSDLNTCYNPSNCTGLSAYYALDITNPENPLYLWEFTHPRLGYSYSGPAVVTRNGKYFVMFASGPTALDGSSNQNVHTFVLTLNDQLGISSVYVKDYGSSMKNGFGGRLFTEGLDVNTDGNTDFVTLGFSYQATTNNSDNWKGGMIKVWTGYKDPSTGLSSPANWDYNTQYFNAAQEPITAKIEFEKCFNTWYVFAGSGRYFSPGEQYSTSHNDWIMGAPFVCDENNTCAQSSLNFAHSNAEACSSLTNKGTMKAWNIELDPADGVAYYKERNITDPTMTSLEAGSSMDMVFFTTAEPTSVACTFGGRSRVWGLNCATGAAISDTSCPGYVVKDVGGGLYMQTSTGAIYRILRASSFSQNSGRASDWFEGMPPESSTPFLPPFQMRKGQIMHWIEK
jgi:type IV pilus assembly protein PilY1